VLQKHRSASWQSTPSRTRGRAEAPRTTAHAAPQQRRILCYGTTTEVAGEQRGSPGTPPGAGQVRRLGREQYPSLPGGRQQTARTCQDRCKILRTRPACRSSTRSYGSFDGAGPPARHGWPQCPQGLSRDMAPCSPGAAFQGVNGQCGPSWGRTGPQPRCARFQRPCHSSAFSGSASHAVTTPQAQSRGAEMTTNTSPSHFPITLKRRSP